MKSSRHDKTKRNIPFQIRKIPIDFQTWQLSKPFFMGACLWGRKDISDSSLLAFANHYKLLNYHCLRHNKSQPSVTVCFPKSFIYTCSSSRLIVDLHIIQEGIVLILLDPTIKLLMWVWELKSFRRFFDRLVCGAEPPVRTELGNWTKPDGPNPFPGN